MQNTIITTSKKGDHYANIMTPIAECYFAQLNTPNTRFKPEGEYSITLIFDPKNPEWESFQALVAEMEKRAAETAEAKNTNPYRKPRPILNDYGEGLLKADRNRETNEPTGNLRITFKNGAFITRGDNKTPVVIGLFDSAANRIPQTERPLIGNGSKVRVRATLGTYNTAMGYGVRARLSDVQIIDLVAYENASEGPAFDAIKGGYIGSEPQNTPTPAAGAFTPQPVPGSLREIDPQEENGDF